MNQADEIMATTPTSCRCSRSRRSCRRYTKFVNIRDNANLSGPTYNIQEWGQKAA